jgi:hypothetical protein
MLRWLVRVSVLMGLVVVLCGNAQATAPSPTTVIPAHVTFSVFGGAFTGALTFNGASNASDSFGFVVTYPAEIEEDGTLAVTGPGTYMAGFPGTYHYTDSTYSVDCRGTIPLGAGAAAPTATVSATSPQTLVVQSVTAVDQNGSSGFETCQGTAPGSGEPFDGSGEAASLVGAFAASLPDVFSAKITIPSGRLDGGFYEHDVTSSVDVAAQLPPSCADQFGVPQGSCQMTLSWTGTVRISADNCRRNIFSITCIGPRDKQDAKSDLDSMHANDPAVNGSVQQICSSTRGPRFRDPNNPGNPSVGFAMCGGASAWRSARRSEEKQDEQVIADPPDPAYSKVATPHVNDKRAIEKVKRGLPRFAAWIHREDVLDATLIAMTTALNRASGAALAGATGALTSQETAVAHYAQQAGALMRSEPAVAGAAARELRRLQGSRGAHAVARRLAALVDDPKVLASRVSFGRALETTGK